MLSRLRLKYREQLHQVRLPEVMVSGNYGTMEATSIRSVQMASTVPIGEVFPDGAKMSGEWFSVSGQERFVTSVPRSGSV